MMGSNPLCSLQQNGKCARLQVSDWQSGNPQASEHGFGDTFSQPGTEQKMVLRLLFFDESSFDDGIKLHLWRVG